MSTRLERRSSRQDGATFDYTFGIEEEYFLALSSGALAARVSKDLLLQAQTRLGSTVTSELLQSQIEIASPVFHELREALATMRRLRATLAELAAGFGARPIAASTYPLGQWRDQAITEKPRYRRLMADFRIVSQRNLVCGMHVHVAVPPSVDRVALMNRAMPWLPLFLALSTSSPFWNRRVTGLLSYRQAVYDEWPRSGIPDFFVDEADYAAFAETLQTAGAIPDASYFWWAIRPALRYPTLELRIADVCTQVEDGVALANLFRCLIAALIENPENGATRSTHTRRIIDENRWRAKRDGTDAQFIDEAANRTWSLRETLARLLELIHPQATRLNCLPALQHIERILERGTSAHAQLRLYNERRAAGATRNAALHTVAEWLAVATLESAAPLV